MDSTFIGILLSLMGIIIGAFSVLLGKHAKTFAVLVILATITFGIYFIVFYQKDISIVSSDDHSEGKSDSIHLQTSPSFSTPTQKTTPETATTPEQTIKSIDVSIDDIGLIEAPSNLYFSDEGIQPTGISLNYKKPDDDSNITHYDVVIQDGAGAIISNWGSTIQSYYNLNTGEYQVPLGYCLTHFNATAGIYYISVYSIFRNGDNIVAKVQSETLTVQIDISSDKTLLNNAVVKLNPSSQSPLNKYELNLTGDFDLQSLYLFSIKGTSNNYNIIKKAQDDEISIYMLDTSISGTIRRVSNISFINDKAFVTLGAIQDLPDLT